LQACEFENSPDLIHDSPSPTPPTWRNRYLVDSGRKKKKVTFSEDVIEYERRSVSNFYRGSREYQPGRHSSPSESGWEDTSLSTIDDEDDLLKMEDIFLWDPNQNKDGKVDNGNCEGPNGDSDVDDNVNDAFLEIELGNTSAARLDDLDGVEAASRTDAGQVIEQEMEELAARALGVTEVKDILQGVAEEVSEPEPNLTHEGRAPPGQVEVESTDESVHGDEETLKGVQTPVIPESLLGRRSRDEFENDSSGPSVHSQPDGKRPRTE
jgi:hypothetical protein